MWWRVDMRKEEIDNFDEKLVLEEKSEQKVRRNESVLYFPNQDIFYFP